MAAIRLLLGDLEGAVEWCKRAVKLGPDKPVFHWKFKGVCAIQGDLKAAITVGKKVLTKGIETSDEVRAHQMPAN